MKDICVRVDEGLFRKVTDFAREAGISRGAVLRQLTKKRFECEEMLESLSPVEANLAESLAPVGQSLAESRTPPIPARENLAESRPFAPLGVHVPAHNGVEHLPEHDLLDAEGWTPWERHLLSPGSPNYRSLTI